MATEEAPSCSIALFAGAEASASISSEPDSKRRRVSGRKRDPVWELTTVLPDKRVICNRCHTLIHRYGIAKVERVRKHFERKCIKVQGHLAMGGDEAVGVSQPLESKTGVLISVPIAINSKPIKASNNYGNKNGVFKRKFAHWLYSTAKPFKEAENQLLFSALSVLRTDVVLPTKQELENELLELEYAASKSKISKAVGGKKSCLTVENWVDADGRNVATYGATCDGVQYYLEAKTAATQDVNAELASEEVEEVMAKEKKADFYGIVTPTTAALSKSTRERVQKKHSRCLFFHGCVSQALALLHNDIVSILPWLETVRASVTDLADVFHGNHKLQGLVSATSENNSVEFPVGRSVCALLDDVIKHEKELYTIVARRDFVDASTPAEQEKLKRVQDFVLGETFVQDLVNSLAILRPLQQQLNHFQEDRPSLSQVFPYFVDLLTVYASMEWMTKKEKALITSCVTERFNAIYGDSHGVAYLLDPLYLGEALDERKRHEVETFILRFCEREGHTVDVLAQLEQYKTLVMELKENNHEYWKLLGSGAMTPIDFWMERRQFPELQQLAHVVFALPVSCTFTSPSLGAQGLTVYSRFSRSLSPDKLQKLTHVYCNAKREESNYNPGPQQL